MIGLELSMSSDETHRAELLQTLQNLRDEAVSQGSSHECRVFEDLSGPNHFLWLQWWQSQRDLQDYLTSIGFRTLLGAIKVLGNLESARTVELQDSTSVLGAFLADRGEVVDRSVEK
jgi:quinol monooxygenase YgiN